MWVNRTVEWIIRKPCMSRFALWVRFKYVNPSVIISKLKFLEIPLFGFVLYKNPYEKEFPSDLLEYSHLLVFLPNISFLLILFLFICIIKWVCAEAHLGWRRFQCLSYYYSHHGEHRLLLDSACSSMDAEYQHL